MNKFPSKGRLILESAFGLAIAGGAFWALDRGLLDGKLASAMILFGGFFVSRYIVKDFFRTIALPFIRAIRGVVRGKSDDSESRPR